MLDLSTAVNLASMQWWKLVHEFIFTEWALTSNVQRINRGRGAVGDSSPLKCLFLQDSFFPSRILVVAEYMGTSG